MLNLLLIALVGGVVTNIVTKPLLKLLFPNMYHYSEPLSGMIAIKKDVISKFKLEKDYGVDTGILIDVHLNNIKMEEVNIGEIENLSHNDKTTEKMQIMSQEVITTILKRANKI